MSPGESVTESEFIDICAEGGLRAIMLLQDVPEGPWKAILYSALTEAWRLPGGGNVAFTRKEVEAVPYFYFSGDWQGGLYLCPFGNDWECRRALGWCVWSEAYGRD